MNAVTKESNINMWQGRDGRYTPESLVKDYEKLKEQTLIPLIERWVKLHAELADLKAQMFQDVDTLIETCAGQWGV